MINDRKRTAWKYKQTRPSESKTYIGAQYQLKDHNSGKSPAGPNYLLHCII